MSDVDPNYRRVIAIVKQWGHQTKRSLPQHRGPDWRVEPQHAAFVDQQANASLVLLGAKLFDSPRSSAYNILLEPD